MTPSNEFLMLALCILLSGIINVSLGIVVVFTSKIIGPWNLLWITIVFETVYVVFFIYFIIEQTNHWKRSIRESPYVIHSFAGIICQSILVIGISLYYSNYGDNVTDGTHFTSYKIFGALQIALSVELVLSFLRSFKGLYNRQSILYNKMESIHERRAYNADPHLLG